MSGGLAWAYENGKDLKGWEVTDRYDNGEPCIVIIEKFTCSYDEDPKKGLGFYKTEKLAEKALKYAIKYKMEDLKTEIDYYKNKLKKFK